MNINSFLNQTISLKLIVVVGGFWMIVAAIGVLYFFGGVKEGFQAGLVGIGSALDYKIGDGIKSSWENKGPNNASAGSSEANINSFDMTNSLNMASSTENASLIISQDNAFAALETNESGGDIPLPEGELVFFDKTKFSPECCPSPYSNSEGCVCASPEQMKYLNERGGNRTLTSVY